MSAATPGPWSVRGKRDPIDVLDSAGNRVAVVGLKADAKLISAAPALADSLEAFMKQAHAFSGCFIDQIDAARAALRAAGRLP